MKPGLAQFESASTMDVVEVDLDKKSSSAYTKYGRFFPGGGIPYSVVLDSGGNKVHEMRGFRSYGDLLKETKSFK